MPQRNRNLVLIIIAGVVLPIMVCVLMVVLVWMLRDPLRRQLTQAAEQASLEPSPLIGQLGGGLHSCAMSGNYAYAGMGNRLLVFDLHDPSQPTLVGQSTTLPDPVFNVLVQGNLVYIPDQYRGLYVFDVSDPARPVEVSFTPMSLNPPQGLAISGRYAYAAEYTGVQILDLADPAHPAAIGTLTTDERDFFGDSSIAVGKRYAYWLLWDKVRIIQVDDPAHPVQVGAFDVAKAESLSASGDLVFIQTTEENVEVFDVADPANPTPVTTISALTRSPVVVQGSYLYLAEGCDPDESSYPMCGHVRILDVADPASPVRVGATRITGEPTFVSVDGSLACAAILDPTAPRKTTLLFLDLADPTQPREVGHYVAPLPALRALALAGDFAYAADEFGTMYTVAITPSTAPVVVGALHLADEASDIAAAGSLAYVVAWDGLHVVDVADPYQPVHLSVLPFKDGRYIALSDNMAYVAGDGSLYAIDVARPESPRLLGSYHFPGGGGRLAVGGTTIYLAAYGGGLRILDASRPEQIAELSLYSRNAYEVTLVGETLYVLGDQSSSDMLYVLDVADPAHPVEKQAVELEGETNRLVAADGMLYMGNGYGGLTVVRLPRLNDMRHYRSELPSMWTRDVDVSGNNIFLVGDREGLQILDRGALLK